MRKDFRKSKKGNFKRHRREEFFVPGNALGVKVPDNSPGTLEKALKYLKRQLKDNDTIMQLKANRYYEKPSTKSSRIKNEAIRNQQYQERISKRYGKTCWTAIINGEAQ